MTAVSFQVGYLLSDAAFAANFGSDENAAFTALETRADTYLTNQGFTRTSDWLRTTRRIWTTASGIEVVIQGGSGDTSNSQRFRSLAVIERA